MMPTPGQGMTRRQRRNDSPVFKTKVILAVILGKTATPEPTEQSDVHRTKLRHGLSNIYVDRRRGRES